MARKPWTSQAFGYVQQIYSGVTKIYGEGGNGNDTIVLDAGVVSPAELWGDFNPGNPDNGGATAAGNDTLTGGRRPGDNARWRRGRPAFRRHRIRHHVW